MAIQTFGIVPADISARVQNLNIAADTSPSTTDVNSMILYAAAEVETEALAVGISTESLVETGDATYVLLKNMVIYKVLAELMIGRGRGTEATGLYWIKRYDEMKVTLRKRPLAIEPDKDTGPDLAYTLDLDVPDLWDQPWYGTISGKVVLGGL